MGQHKVLGSRGGWRRDDSGKFWGQQILLPWWWGVVGVRSVLIDRGTERSKGAMRSRHEYLGPFLRNLLCSMQLGNLEHAGRVLSPEVLMEKRFRPEWIGWVGFS